jgi:hypothetical protein
VAKALHGYDLISPNRINKGGGGNSRKPRSMAEASEAMGIDWMTRKEITQAIPPAYAKHIATAAWDLAQNPPVG